MRVARGVQASPPVAGALERAHPFRRCMNTAAAASEAARTAQSPELMAEAALVAGTTASPAQSSRVLRRGAGARPGVERGGPRTRPCIGGRPERGLPRPGRPRRAHAGRHRDAQVGTADQQRANRDVGRAVADRRVGGERSVGGGRRRDCRTAHGRPASGWPGQRVASRSGGRVHLPGTGQVRRRHRSPGIHPMRAVELRPAHGAYFALQCALAGHIGVTDEAIEFARSPFEPLPLFRTMGPLTRCLLLLYAGRPEEAAASYQQAGPVDLVSAAVPCPLHLRVWRPRRC